MNLGVGEGDGQPFDSYAKAKKYEGGNTSYPWPPESQVKGLLQGAYTVYTS